MKKNKPLILVFLIIVVAVFLTPYNFVFADDIVSVHLDVEFATSTLFAGTILVSACAPSTTTTSGASSTPMFSGYCAVLQSGLESTWSSFGDAQFLESVSGITNDYQNNLYWGWFSNLEYGQTSLDQHILTPNENLLVTLGRMPLKIAVSTTTPNVGATTTVSVFQFGFDGAWNGIWSGAGSSNVNITLETYPTDSEGNYDIFVSSSTPFSVFATKNGFVNSNVITVTPIINASTTATLPENPSGGSNDSDENDDSSGSDNSNQNSCNFNLNEAIRFLEATQKSDGSFGSSLYTDWVAVALSLRSQSSSRDGLVSYLKSSDNGFSNVTDYERRAMALMAFKINPYSGTSVNYIQKILDQFDGTQVGRLSLVNDDIFAIFPLIKAGYSANDPIIQKIAAFIVSKQKSDGSWEGSVDLTSASIQALVSVRLLDGVNQSVDKARNFLVTHQQTDGGFGSSFSTSWAIQAIVAMGESSSDWIKNENSPQDALCSSQQNDGGLEPVTTDDSTRVWATAYAIPSALNKSWSMILSSFSKPRQTVLPAPRTPHLPENSLPIAELLVEGDENPENSENPAISATSTTSSTTVYSIKSVADPIAEFVEDVTSNKNIDQSQTQIRDSSQLAAVATGGYPVSSKIATVFAIGLLILLTVAFFFKFKYV
ncbi:MAG: prenyltransferase/squalene oxidase repeat-containing protein [Patescibacteria group bacterium]